MKSFSWHSFKKTRYVHCVHSIFTENTMETVPINSRLAEYDPLVPLVKALRYENVDEQPTIQQVWDINNETNFHKPTFNLGGQYHAAVAPSPTVLTELYFPDSLLEEWSENTMKYAAERLPPSKRNDM